MRRSARQGEMVVFVEGREPTVDECQCLRIKMSDASDLPNPPQYTMDAILHFFDGKPCRRMTREEWYQRTTFPFPIE